MSNVDFKDNIICKYTFSIIIWSIFFCIIESSNYFIKLSSIFKNNLTNRQLLNVYILFFSFWKNMIFQCHLKHAYNTWLAIIYGLWDIVMMWSIELNQIIKRHGCMHKWVGPIWVSCKPIFLNVVTIAMPMLFNRS